MPVASYGRGEAINPRLVGIDRKGPVVHRAFCCVLSQTSRRHTPYEAWRRPTASGLAVRP